MADKTVSNNTTTGQNTQTNVQEYKFIPKDLYAGNVTTPCYNFYSHGANPCKHCTYLGPNPEYIKALIASGYIP